MKNEEVLWEHIPVEQNRHEKQKLETTVCHFWGVNYVRKINYTSRGLIFVKKQWKKFKLFLLEFLLEKG